MGILPLIGIGIGLAMDSLAVAITAGIALKRVYISHVLRLSLVFGIFHVFMPILGWVLGHSVEKYVSAWDHWLAFAIFLVIGLKAIYSAIKSPEQSSEKSEVSAELDPTSGWSLIMLAFATSIDALGIGVGFAFLKVDIIFASIIIGSVVAAITMVGIKLGNILGANVGKRLNILCGLILIGIGLKILLESIL